MDPINDFSWIKHLHTGEIIERFTLGEYRAIAIRIPTTDRSPINQYRYRMLFFPAAEHKPVFAVNLEFSILGSYMLTQQRGSQHLKYDQADESTSYEEFRRRAVERACGELKVAANDCRS